MSLHTLKRRAEIDLEGIWRYSAEHWGDDRADLYVTELWRGIWFVAEDPRRGRPCDDIKTGYYHYAVGSHVLFHRLPSTGIEIVRILHQRMDFRRHLRRQFLPPTSRPARPTTPLPAA